MNQHANHHGPATLDHDSDCEQIVSLKSKRHEAGLPDPDLTGGSLVERLDPALAEATTGMGALLSELIRRTLRGGVQRIDEELQSQVEEKVDATVAERMPQVESAAGQAAEAKARQVVGRECQAIQQDLGQQIAASSHRVEKTARDLIHEQVESLTQRSKSTLQSLNGRIDGLRGSSDALELRIEQLEGQLTRMAARIIALEKPGRLAAHGPP